MAVNFSDIFPRQRFDPVPNHLRPFQVPRNRSTLFASCVGSLVPGGRGDDLLKVVRPPMKPKSPKGISPASLKLLLKHLKENPPWPDKPIPTPQQFRPIDLPTEDTT